MANSPTAENHPRSLALAGGVGGAKLAAGLQAALAPEDLTVVVNTADDFRLWGLHISPDMDTVMYTLAGIANQETGWGIQGESFDALTMLGDYGEDTWFKLGDRDIATHLLRTERLGNGESLTEITASLASSLGVRTSLMPMCDEPVSTILHTPDGVVAFQDYFVRRAQADEVLGIELNGIREAQVSRAVSEAVRNVDVIVICPSNPVVSIGPILAVPGMTEALTAATAPKVAVSPIVGGRALKGPADQMMQSLGHEVSATGVARVYDGLVDGMIVDRADASEQYGIERLGMEVLATDTVMKNQTDRARLAREVLEFGRRLAA
ncbi:2-phospho-L-lactate transferase [soil metagenome]